MKEMDGRKLDHNTLEEIRIRAVKRVEAGESPEIVIKALGFHRSCIYDWIAKYREGGIEALRARLLFGRPTKLDGKQLRLIYNTSKPLFLVLDNHSVHRSEKVNQFVERTQGKLKLFFLPPYSPELNPDELVWNTMKRTIAKQVVTSKKDLKKRVVGFLRSLQKMPEKVRQFFKHPLIKWSMRMSAYF